MPVYIIDLIFSKERMAKDMILAEAKEGEEYIVKDISSEDEELKVFLFSLGCYSGEPITVIAHIPLLEY